MTALTNSFEGGSGGTPVSTGNSGGASGSAFDSVTIGSGATLAFDNAQAAHGGLSCQVATGVTSVSSFAVWSTSLGSQTQVWFRQYLYFTANPAATIFVYRAMQGATLCAQLGVLSTGALRFQDSAGVTIFTTSAVIPLNQWFRIEGFVTGNATTGQVELKLFNSADSATATETDTSAATQNTTGTIDTSRFGITVAAASAGPIWMDDLGVSSTGYLGPAVAPPPPAELIPPGLQSPMALQLHFPPPPPPPPPLAVTSGAPVRPLASPVQARQLPQQGGRTTSRDGPYGQAGPPVRPLAGPVRGTVPAPVRGGRTTSRDGLFGGVGPAVKALASAVAGRLRGLPPRGRTKTRTGVYGQLGPAVRALLGPVQARRQPPPARGRAGSARGPYGQTGPPVVRLRRAVRGQPATPLLTGRTAGHTGTAPVVTPFTVGALSASTAPTATQAPADGAASVLTGSTAAAGALTAGDQRTGGPG